MLGGEDNAVEAMIRGGADPLGGGEGRGAKDGGVSGARAPFRVGEGVEAEMDEEGHL